MAQKQTTGATISRLAVLTVLSANMVESKHVNPMRRAAMVAERDSILAGEAGVPTGKVVARTLQRCQTGSALITVGPVGIYGAN